MSSYADAMRHWREAFNLALREHQPYRQPHDFRASAPPITFDDPKLLENDEYLQFVDVYLDLESKHDLEHPQAPHPEMCFTARRLELARAFPNESVRSAALSRVLRDHLNTFGPARADALLATFNQNCSEARQRGEIEALYKTALREHVDHEVVTYRTTKNGELSAHIFSPARDTGAARRPAICFFFGGGWYIGMPDQFFNFCRYFAARGFVAVSFEYRTKGRCHATPIDAMHDTRFALRWLRKQAEQWRIDPNRVAACGWSAGGHLAACLPIIESFEEPGAETSVSARPDAVVLIAACINPTADNWFWYVLGGQSEPAQLSPLHHVRSGLPPFLVYLGTRDEFIPLPTTREFVERMTAAGNRCELVVAEGYNHGAFMNDATCAQMHKFLGW